MKLLAKTTFALAAAAAFTATAANAAVVNISSVTGHNGGNWPNTLGHLSDMVNGNGSSDPGSTGDHNPGMDTSADINDPSTWVNSSGSWQTEWLANGRLDSTASANSKIGWTVLSFAPTSNLENLYIWNARNNSPGEDTRDFNIYYSNGAGIDALPATPNSQAWAGGSQAAADYDFGSGDWSQIGSTLTLASPSSPWGPQATIALGGISAQYIGIEILTAENTDPNDRVGLAQIEITSGVIPEPSAFALFGLGSLGLILRRRRKA